ncbi:MAG: LacI family DNA-binding transcriptional regulator [Candidatus Omnitrophica bacterium]|nr:LacI family DNA-binding transcriptional regulator [Candidatus Omnitrophota bacterium]
MKKIDIAEVAKAAGVSTTTVSRVINHVPTVSEENRQRVLEAVKKLKYRPNPSARRLASGQNDTIGIVIPRFADMFHSFYVSELLKGVGTGVERLKLNLLLHVTDGHSSFDLSSVAGVLFADIDGNEEQLDWVMDQGIPCVVTNHFIKELPVSCIAVDNLTASEQVVAYLANLGHREIATIAGHLRTPVGIERLEGYLKAMKARDIEVKPHFVQRGDYSGPSAREPARRLLTHDDRPTAIFAASDEMAVTTIEVALGLGLRVPEDLSVVGFDDSPIAAFAKVPLTTVWQPLSQVGELSVEVLDKLMGGKLRRPVKTQLGTKLVERQSCRQTWLEH